MDVYPGFSSSLTFDYAAIDAAGKVGVYSGLDGTGTLLADVALPVTSPIAGPGNFVTDSVSLSGIGYSVVFDGGNKQLALDDLILAAVPEPPAWCLLAVGGVLAGLASGSAPDSVALRRPSRSEVVTRGDPDEGGRSARARRAVGVPWPRRSGASLVRSSPRCRTGAGHPRSDAAVTIPRDSRGSLYLTATTSAQRG